MLQIGFLGDNLDLYTSNVLLCIEVSSTKALGSSLSLMLSPSFFTEIAALLSAYLGSSLKRQQWGNTVISVVGLILFSSSGIVVPVSDFLCKSITIQNNQEITSKESIDDGKGLDVCNQHG